MRRAALRRYLLRFGGHLRGAVRQWTGDEEYERYVRDCVAHQQAPLDRGRYFAQRLEERYRRVSRCC